MDFVGHQLVHLPSCERGDHFFRYFSLGTCQKQVSMQCHSLLTSITYGNMSCAIFDTYKTQLYRTEFFIAMAPSTLRGKLKFPYNAIKCYYSIVEFIEDNDF